MFGSADVADPHRDGVVARVPKLKVELVTFHAMVRNFVDFQARPGLVAFDLL